MSKLINLELEDAKRQAIELWTWLVETGKEKRRTKMATQTLSIAWRRRLELRSEGAKLWDEADRLEGEGAELRSEGDELRDESEKLWVEAIRSAYGNIAAEWKNWNSKYGYECHLENGEVYGFEKEA